MMKRSTISGNLLFLLLILIEVQCISGFDFPPSDFGQFIPKAHYKTSQWTPHSPIFVHGIVNFTQTANAESWPGDGTRANPYIIEGYNISNIGSLIVIQDSPLYFTIRDCFLNESSRVGRGIVISGTSNGIIEDNMIFGSFYGIELNNSDHTLIQRNELTNQSIGIMLNSSNQDEIYNNVIANNLNYGISMEEGSNYNSVAWNAFYFNGGVSSEAFDDGLYNIFVFNYWNTLTSPDNNGDEIVDVPYLLDGTSNNRDSYPLIEFTFPGPLPDIHEMLEPKILYPNGGVVNSSGTLNIQWLKAFDCKDHTISYSLEYSEDSGSNWISIITGLELTYYEWDVSDLNPNSTFIIRLTASCTEFLVKSDNTDATFSINFIPPFVPPATTTQTDTDPLTTTSASTTRTTSQPSETFSESIQANLTDFIPPLFVISLLLVGLIIGYRYKITASSGARIESLKDLKRKRAVPIKTLTKDLECSRLELPQKLRHKIGDKKVSIVLRSEMIILEDHPPPDSMCQICTGKLEGMNYLQCMSCLRYVCVPHFVDLIKLEEGNCPNCKGELSIFPFTCEGCKLDYNQTIDVKGNSEVCKLCGFTLPSQRQLITDATKDIFSKLDGGILKEQFYEKEKINSKNNP